MSGSNTGQGTGQSSQGSNIQQQPVDQSVPANQHPVPASNNNNDTQVSVFTGLTNLISSLLGSICGTFIGIIQYTLNLLRGQPSATNRTRIEPATEVANHIKYFETKYGTAHPTFFPGSYNTALNEAKVNLKFLLVYLHCKSHQDTDSFCSNTLTHQEVISYLNRNTSVIFWSINVDSSEGARVSAIVSEYSYPFLALICLRENRMTIVRKFEGFLSVEALLSQIQQGIEDNESSLVAARSERDTLSMNQQIRNAQDDEYQQSLAVDQAKERERAAAAEIKRKEEEAKQAKEAEEKRQLDKLIALKSDLERLVPPEPTVDEASDTIRVLIKLPNGSRLERKFRKTSSIKFLYYFVFSHQASPLSFEITTNFPRKTLPCSSPTLSNPECYVTDPETGEKTDPITFEQFGLGKSEMLFVHDLES